MFFSSTPQPSCLLVSVMSSSGDRCNAAGGVSLLLNDPSARVGRSSFIMLNKLHNITSDIANVYLYGEWHPCCFCNAIAAVYICVFGLGGGSRIMFIYSTLCFSRRKSLYLLRHNTGKLGILETHLVLTQ